MRILLFIIFCARLNCTAQVNENEAVKNIIVTFFEGFHAGDVLKMQSVMLDSITFQTAYTNQKGVSILETHSATKLIQAIANRPKNEKWEERILDYVVQVDGTMASVWTPYEFWFNGTFSHCGANSFQLFKDNTTWKIIYLIDSRRRMDCGIKN